MKETEYDKLYKYVEEKEVVNYNYRKSLVEKSRFPKLAHWWLIGYHKSIILTLKYKKDGEVCERTFNDFPVYKQTKKDAFYSALSLLSIDEKDVISKSFKKIKVENKYISSSRKNKFSYKVFLRKIGKMSREGISLRGKHFSPIVKRSIFDKRPIMEIWFNEDCLYYLIVKLTISALALNKYGTCYSNIKSMREMWRARKILLDLAMFEENEETYVDKKIEEKYGIKDHEDYLHMLRKDEYIENGELYDRMEFRERVIKDNDYNAYSMVYYPKMIAEVFNLKDETPEERKVILEKEEEFTKIVMSIKNERASTYHERLKEKWKEAGEALQHLFRWND